MQNKLSLEKITSLLLAADRIRSTTEAETRVDGSISVKPDALSIIRDSMLVISEFLPEQHKPAFSNALDISHRYCGTYRNLKRHLISIGGQQPNLNSLMNTIKVIMPMLENKQRAPLGKVLNVLEAIYN